MCEVEVNDQIRNHFNQEAHEYDELIRKLIPFYDTMLGAVVDAIPFQSDTRFSMLDLGCGTGNLTAAIANRFPNVYVKCLDFAENMVRITSERLSERNIKPIIADLFTWQWEEIFDAVVSSLVLHHQECDLEKEVFYRKIYNHIRPGGVFCIADIVLGANLKLTDAYHEKWKNYMLQNVSEEMINHVVLDKYRSEDFPARLSDHIKWMQKAGFKDVDVIWKYYNVAVVCGYR